MKHDSRFTILLWMIFLSFSSYQAFHVDLIDEECGPFWAPRASCCFNDTEEIEHFSFCIRRESCIISQPSIDLNKSCIHDDTDYCEWYVCYGQERRWKNLSVSVPDHATGIPLYTTLEVHMEDIFPAPIVEMTFNHTVVVSPSMTNGFDYYYRYNFTEYGKYILIITVPGFLTTFTDTYILEAPNDQPINVLTITLATVIPGCLLISIIISIVFCYKKQLFCFRGRNHTRFTRSTEVSSPAPINEYSANPSNVVGDAFDDATFTEIDLTDGDSGVHQVASPMSSYIQTVTARYTKPTDHVTLGPKKSVEDEFDQEENSAIHMVGRCRALEDFLASQHEDTSGLIDKVDKGQELIVIQEDLGTGWTCIQTTGGSTGFLPTSILYFL